jgi:Ser/Thr protein kinase RdoA (MazF antagonist)
VAERYAIGRVLDCSALHGGMFERPALLLTEGGKYVLRRQAFRRAAATFRFQAEAIAFAADAGVRCPRVVRAIDGNWSVSTEDGLWALYEYCDGQAPEWAAWCAAKDAATLRCLGAQVAGVHNVLAAARPAGDPRLRTSLPPIQFDKLSAVERDWRARMQALARAERLPAAETRAALIAADARVQQAFRLVASATARLPRLGIRRRVVHGDISPVNMIFGQGDPTFALIDWDCTHYGYRLYDALGDVLFRAPWDQPQLHTASVQELRDYLAGYVDAARPAVTEVELAMAPTFCVARQLEDLRQRLAVIEGLAPERDHEYACLVRMRLGFIGRLTDLAEASGRGEPWN